MSETTDIRRAMAQAVRAEERRTERQLKAISRAAKIDLDRFASPAREPQAAPAAQRIRRADK